MPQNASQVPWTDEQWGRVRQVIQEEAARARVAASFLPLYGPLPPNADFVTADRMSYVDPVSGQPRMAIDDTTTLLLPTLQVKVFLRGAQMADPELGSALQMFRRAANVLARLEDELVFNGLAGRGKLARGGYALPDITEILGGQECRGLLQHDAAPRSVVGDRRHLGEELVSSVSDAIGRIEARGHFGPFAVVLDQRFFTAVQTPQKDSLVLPQDRIVPFLGGGPLLRSSALPEDSGVVVALGAAPVELVVATDTSLNFLQVTTDPMFVFRVFEKVLLRIKEEGAIESLAPTAPDGGRGGKAP